MVGMCPPPAQWHLLSRVPGWSSKLSRPVKGGPVLRTLRDARAFVIDHFPPDDHDRVAHSQTTPRRAEGWLGQGLHATAGPGAIPAGK